MLYSIHACSAIIVLLLTALPVEANEVERGQLLYENHCTACHESSIHIRERRQVDSAVALRSQVVRWTELLELPWTVAEIDDVSRYLDRRFYRFREADARD